MAVKKTFLRARISGRYERALRALERYYGVGPSEAVRNALRETAVRLDLWPAAGEAEAEGGNGRQEVDHAE